MTKFFSFKTFDLSQFHLHLYSDINAATRKFKKQNRSTFFQRQKRSTFMYHRLQRFFAALPNWFHCFGVFERQQYHEVDFKVAKWNHSDTTHR